MGINRVRPYPWVRQAGRSGKIFVASGAGRNRRQHATRICQAVCRCHRGEVQRANSMQNPCIWQTRHVGRHHPAPTKWRSPVRISIARTFRIHYSRGAGFLHSLSFPDGFRATRTDATHGPQTRKLEKYYHQKRLELLSIIEEGWQIWTANKPIRSPVDFKGITFRVMASPLLITAYRLYGAYAITVPYGRFTLILNWGASMPKPSPFLPSRK